MGLIWTILIGAFVGWVASIIMRRDAQQGWLGNILVGIVGAFLGGFIASLFGSEAGLRFDLASVFWSVVGAVALCAALNYYQRGQIR